MNNLKSVKAGKPLVNLIKLCYKADLPVLLVGKHGVGKSQILEQAALELDVDFLCRDLSLMEPPDLVGLPKMDGNTTRYLPPSFLPTGGRGLLCFEELNRCPTYMRAPCLQLLTARQLNDYLLPEGWLPVAAINPASDKYEVQELDDALSSRFVKVEVVADRKEWLDWAKGAGLNKDVMEYVDYDNRIFQDTCPRDWTGVSCLMEVSKEWNRTLEVAVTGLVGRERMAAFRAFLKGGDYLPSIKDLLAYYEKHAEKLNLVSKKGQTDILDDLLYKLKVHFQNEDNYQQAVSSPVEWGNLGMIVSHLVPDMKEDLAKFFQDRSYVLPTI